MYHQSKSTAQCRPYTTSHTHIKFIRQLVVSWCIQSWTKKCKKETTALKPKPPMVEAWSGCNPILVGTGSARTKTSHATSSNAIKMYTELCTVFPKVHSWWHIWNCSQLRHFDIFFCTVHKVNKDHSISKLNWLLRNWLSSKTKDENKYSTLHRKSRNTKIKCIHKHGNGVFILYWNYTAR